MSRTESNFLEMVVGMKRKVTTRGDGAEQAHVAYSLSTGCRKYVFAFKDGYDISQGVSCK